MSLKFLHVRVSDANEEDGEGNPNRDPCMLEYCDTNKMAADIYTKAFTNAQKWLSALRLINIWTPQIMKQIKKCKYFLSFQIIKHIKKSLI